MILGNTLFRGNYPDPAYVGALGVTPRRFWIGPVHNGPWIIGPYPNDQVFQNYQAPWQIFTLLENTLGTVSSVNTTDTNNSYLDALEEFAGWILPGFIVGGEIYQNAGNTWTTVLPWDATERARWIYPNPLLPTTKIYYNNYYDFTTYLHGDFQWFVESAGAGSVPFTVDAADPSVITHQYFSDNMESVVTECGEDEQGAWIKVRAAVEGDGDPLSGSYDQVLICAGNGMNVNRRSFTTQVGAGYIEIVPWSRPTATGSIYIGEQDGLPRIVQRETPSMQYMSEKTVVSLLGRSMGTPLSGVCTDGTYLYFFCEELMG